MERKQMHVLRKHKWAWLVFVAPSFALYTYFVIISIGYSVYYSLTKWNAISPPVYVGVKNYVDLWKSADFAIVMQNTVVGLVLALIIQVGLGLTFAYLIYRTRLGFRLYRGLVFLPVVLSAAAVALMFTLVFNADVGPVNSMLKAIGLGVFRRNWLSDKNVVFYSVLTPMIWQFIGLYVVILLAGMQSIPEEVIQSSTIDGASSFRTFRSIVIPMQWDIIFICIALITAGSFKAFEHSYIMTWGGPGVRSAFLGVFMYNKTFLSALFGVGSSIAMVILAASLIVTMLSRVIIQRFDY
jgi:raffinose/stachyose/melibiose transport system permease protein